jgi:hypothetical protein
LEQGVDPQAGEDAAAVDSSEALLEFGKVLNAFVQCSNLKVRFYHFLCLFPLQVCRSSTCMLLSFCGFRPYSDVPAA